jgi:hypothetical protein
MAEPIQCGKKIGIIPNENYFSILSTYEDNDIMEQSKAEGKLKEYQPIYHDIIQRKKFKPVSYTPGQFVEQFYSLLARALLAEKSSNNEALVGHLSALLRPDDTLRIRRNLDVFILGLGS